MDAEKKTGWQKCNVCLDVFQRFPEGNLEPHTGSTKGLTDKMTKQNAYYPFIKYQYHSFIQFQLSCVPDVFFRLNDKVKPLQRCSSKRLIETYFQDSKINLRCLIAIMEISSPKKLDCQKNGNFIPPQKKYSIYIIHGKSITIYKPGIKFCAGAPRFEPLALSICNCSTWNFQVRLRYGPELKDVAPQYAKQFDQALGKKKWQDASYGWVVVQDLGGIFANNTLMLWVWVWHLQSIKFFMYMFKYVHPSHGFLALHFLKIHTKTHLSHFVAVVVRCFGEL